MTDELSGRVERGAAWLDAAYPEWWTHVDLGDLDLANCCRCVLGQVFDCKEWLSGFSTVEDLLAKANMPDTWMAEHGFSLAVKEFRMLGYDGYRTLDELWIAVIKQRWESGVRS